MPDILFDKLAYKDRLTHEGIPDDQARAHADALHEALQQSVATKADITAVRTDLLALEHRITVRVGLMIGAAVTILIGVKFFG